MTDPQSIVLFLVLSKRTAMMKLQDIFPECFLYREKSPRTDPLICLKDNACHVGQNCMEGLVKRLRIMFEEFLPEVDLILLYFKRSDDSMGAGVFWRDFREPRVITVNKSAWKRIKNRSEIYEFIPEPRFFLGAQSPTENAPDSLSLAK